MFRRLGNASHSDSYSRQFHAHPCDPTNVSVSRGQRGGSGGSPWGAGQAEPPLTLSGSRRRPRLRRQWGGRALPTIPPSLPRPLPQAPSSPAAARGSPLSTRCPHPACDRLALIHPDSRAPALSSALPQPRCHRGPGSQVTGHHADWGAERVAVFRLRKEKAPPRGPNVKSPNGGRLRPGTAAPAGNRRRRPGRGTVWVASLNAVSCDPTKHVQGHEARKLRECVL